MIRVYIWVKKIKVKIPFLIFIYIRFPLIIWKFFKCFFTKFFTFFRIFSKNINIAIKKVEELGYKILSNKKLDDKKNYPYQLNISRMDNAIYSHINQVVWKLIEITEPLNGYYDGWGCPITK